MDFLLNAISQYERTYGKDERHAKRLESLRAIRDEMRKEAPTERPSPGRQAAIDGASGRADATVEPTRHEGDQPKTFEQAREMAKEMAA